MYLYEVAPLKIVRNGSSSFTYSSSEPLAIGQVVRVGVGKSLLTGIIITHTTTDPAYAVKPIDSVLDMPAIPEHYISLALWIHEYYATHLATVLQTMLPSGIHKKRRSPKATHAVHARSRTNYVLNPQQTAALETINTSKNSPILLHGITGSGKTAVYIEAASHVISNNQSVIVLVPEIALTSQLVSEFSQHFPNIIVTHSRQTESERHQQWVTALTATEPVVVIGPRSALFMPIASLGLIVIDEAHEPTYKQEQSPRYHAARVATYLAQLAGAKLIIGSATPTVLDYHLAQSRNKPIVVMDKLAVSHARKPAIDIIDMTKRAHFTRHRFLSNKAIETIEHNVGTSQQTLVFHNRRGSAPTTLCESCGWQAGCPKCYVPLTLHADAHELRCHICNFTTSVPTSCPECHSASILHKGIGTKLIESELRRLFPSQSIARFDADAASGESVDQRYSDLYSGDIDIIIGTQVIAKGLDLPKLRSVVIVQADAGLSLPDYSSTERTFQLLAQVIGRVGRSSHETNVIVQSYQPTHPIIGFGLKQDYASFYDFTLAQRKYSLFPPFTYLLKLQCVYKTEAAAIRNSQTFAKELRGHFGTSIEVLGPTPAFYERAGGTYRWQLVIKSPSRSTLLEVLKKLPPSHWQFELDPISLL